MSQPMVVLLVVTFTGGALAGYGFAHARARFYLWRTGEEGQQFGSSLRKLAVVSLVVGALVVAVQSRGGR